MLWCCGAIRYMPRTGEAAVAAEVAREEKADAEWLHNEELLRKQKEEREAATNEAEPAAAAGAAGGDGGGGDVEQNDEAAAPQGKGASAALVESVSADDGTASGRSASDQSPTVEAEARPSETHDLESKSKPGAGAE